MKDHSVATLGRIDVKVRLVSFVASEEFHTELLIKAREAGYKQDNPRNAITEYAKRSMANLIGFQGAVSYKAVPAFRPEWAKGFTNNQWNSYQKSNDAAVASVVKQAISDNWLSDTERLRRAITTAETLTRDSALARYTK